MACRSPGRRRGSEAESYLDDAGTGDVGGRAGPGRAACTRGCGLGVASGDHGSAGKSRLVLSCGEELGDRVPQLAQRRLHGAADDLGVHPVVMMGQQIPQPGDL